MPKCVFNLQLTMTIDPASDSSLDEIALSTYKIRTMMSTRDGDLYLQYAGELDMAARETIRQMTRVRQ